MSWEMFRCAPKVARSQLTANVSQSMDYLRPLIIALKIDATFLTFAERTKLHRAFFGSVWSPPLFSHRASNEISSGYFTSPLDVLTKNIES